MSVSQIGSVFISGGRMNLAAGMTLAGWIPGAPIAHGFTPIIGALKCRPGQWFVMRAHESHWTNDLYGLVHSDFKTQSSWEILLRLPSRSLRSFESRGRVRVSDSMNLDKRITFPVHPGRWELGASWDNHRVHTANDLENVFFLLHHYQPDAVYYEQREKILRKSALAEQEPVPAFGVSG